MTATTISVPPEPDDDVGVVQVCIPIPNPEKERKEEEEDEDPEGLYFAGAEHPAPGYHNVTVVYTASFMANNVRLRYLVRDTDIGGDGGAADNIITWFSQRSGDNRARQTSFPARFLRKDHQMLKILTMLAQPIHYVDMGQFAHGRMISLRPHQHGKKEKDDDKKFGYILTRHSRRCLEMPWEEIRPDQGENPVRIYSFCLITAPRQVVYGISIWHMESFGPLRSWKKQEHHRTALMRLLGYGDPWFKMPAVPEIDGTVAGAITFLLFGCHSRRIRAPLRVFNCHFDSGIFYESEACCTMFGGAEKKGLMVQ